MRNKIGWSAFTLSTVAIYSIFLVVSDQTYIETIGLYIFCISLIASIILHVAYKLMDTKKAIMMWGATGFIEIYFAIFFFLFFLFARNLSVLFELTENLLLGKKILLRVTLSLILTLPIVYGLFMEAWL